MPAPDLVRKSSGQFPHCCGGELKKSKQHDLLFFAVTRWRKLEQAAQIWPCGNHARQARALAQERAASALRATRALSNLTSHSPQKLAAIRLLIQISPVRAHWRPLLAPSRHFRPSLSHPYG